MLAESHSWTFGSGDDLIGFESDLGRYMHQLRQTLGFILSYKPEEPLTIAAVHVQTEPRESVMIFFCAPS